MHDGKCSCSKSLPGNICSFCGHVCHVLNFRDQKICMREIPESMKSKVVPIDKYFKNIKCETFFIYDRKSISVEVLLDNPSKHRIPKKVGEYE